jgi:hypothetical protein
MSKPSAPERIFWNTRIPFGMHMFLHAILSQVIPSENAHVGSHRRGQAVATDSLME